MYESLMWKFGPTGSEDNGPNDSIVRTFKGNKYYSLAREVIQNSLDAVLDKSEPVRVEFELFEISRSLLPALFELKDPVERCKSKWADIPAFQKFCDAAIDCLSQNQLTCLRIGDYNTRGLGNDSGDRAFYAFMQAVGYTNKTTEGAGGSFGFGKGAYYAASVLSTIFVSSVYDDAEAKFLFQGKTRLATHLSDEGERKDHVGLFGGTSESPETDPSAVPDILRRTSRGTDVMIVGFDDNEHTWKENLVRSVLNNFWMAILDGKLEVSIDGTVIDSGNIEQTSEKYYKDLEDGPPSNPEKWNPLPYIRAVKHKDGPSNRCFSDELPTLGSVKLFVHLQEGLSNRTAYMRSPRMTVFKKTSNKSQNYSAVFLCDDPEGNEILRQMENPEHNEWNSKNYLVGDRPHAEALLAEKEFRNFVSSNLNKLSNHDQGGKHLIVGLEEYLSIPEDLLPDQEGDGEQVGLGLRSHDEISETETAIETTRKGEGSIIHVVAKTPVAPQHTSGSTDGDIEIFTGGMQGGESDQGDETEGENAGDQKSKGSLDGSSQIKKPLPLRQRSIAQRDSEGRLFYLIKLFSKEKVIADLSVLAGVDSDAVGDDSLIIKSAAKAGARLQHTNNRITNVELEPGENLLRVEFDSNQKYSLRINPYEV